MDRRLRGACGLRGGMSTIIHSGTNASTDAYGRARNPRVSAFEAARFNKPRQRKFLCVFALSSRIGASPTLAPLRKRSSRSSPPMTSGTILPARPMGRADDFVRNRKARQHSDVSTKNQLLLTSAKPLRHKLMNSSLTKMNIALSIETRAVVWQRV